MVKLPRTTLGAYKTVHKDRVNQLVCRMVRNGNFKSAVVADHTNMGTTTALIRSGAINPSNIVTVNNDKKICSSMRIMRTGAKIVHSDFEKITRLELPSYGNNFIYMDVQGAPHKNLFRAFDLIDNCIISSKTMFGVTFSKRVGKGKCYVNEKNKFVRSVTNKLKSRGLNIADIADGQTHKCLAYGGGRGSKQSSMETMFFTIV